MKTKCRACNDGRIVLLTNAGRVESFCHCSTGLRRKEDKLRADLLAAFNTKTKAR
jgi:hypothetical protein